MACPEISTLAGLPFHVAGRYPKPALMRRCTAGGFDVWSSRELFEQVRDLSLGLAALGVEPGSRVAVVSDSRPEWVIADLAILAGGAVTVPIYPTLPPAQVGYVLADAGAVAVVASDEAQAAKVRAVRPDLPGLRALLVIDAPADAPARERETTCAAVRAAGRERLMREDGLARAWKEAASAIEPDRLATIIYTSGTTGDPKGVMLTHGAVIANLADVDTLVSVDDRDDALSFLPLSHAFERAVVYQYLIKGSAVTFAESMETVARDMARVRPTVMTGVPRVYEKLQARVLENVAQASPLRQRLFRWALRVGGACGAAARAGARPPLADRIGYPLADRLVLSRVRERTGGRLRLVLSGGAPLPVPVAEFLFAVGIPVLEGYGLTETAPVLTLNPEDAPRLGTVGKALPRVELRFADDGEILVRGPNVMRGYYGKPEATAAALEGGWFHTGDVGRLDEAGYLVITDRKKELLVTASGKNVAPQPIEQQLRRSPLVGEALLVGDRRPFVAALIVPDVAALAAAVGAPADADRSALVSREDVRRRFDAIIDAVNAELPRHEQIRKYALVPAELSVATGELTPTLKLKRRVVAARWRDEIEALYA